MTDLSLDESSAVSPMSAAADFSPTLSGTRLPVDTALRRASTSSCERMSLMRLSLDDEFREEGVADLAGRHGVGIGLAVAPVAVLSLLAVLAVGLQHGEDGVDLVDDGFLDLQLALGLDQV